MSCFKKQDDGSIIEIQKNPDKKADYITKELITPAKIGLIALIYFFGFYIFILFLLIKLFQNIVMRN